MDRTPPDTARRNEAGERRFGSIDELRDFCRAIEQGWFRCQALAIGSVTLSNDADVVAACFEAEAAAQTEEQVYKQVACLAWPISALITRGRIETAEEMAERSIAASGHVTPSSSRAEALVGLLEAVWPLGERFQRAIYEQLFELLAHDPHWRVMRACRDAALMYADADQPDWLADLLGSCPTQKVTRRIREDRAAGVRIRIRVYVGPRAETHESG
ncbi:MAG: hypothetical protein LAT64_13250 [Phycisphaerales bacterium]|nr:hypothetical protein [Planctomycetota bacterium]MCH8509721.1 hypothetical protein [Phycisphaerales bacterium]